VSSHVATLRAPGRSAAQEKVLRVRAATFPRRLFAVAIDTVLVGAVALGVTVIAALVLDVRMPTARELGPDFVLSGLLDRNPMTLGATGLVVGLGALYQIYLGGVVGQTIGLRIAGLRIISIHGNLPGPARALLRTVALCFSLAPVGLGWIWCLFDRERRALHDHLAGTFVICER